MSALERQLRLLRGYALLTYPFACVPFLFLYFQEHGIDQSRYGEIVGAYYLAMFVAEVPTGVLADRFGPKVMMALGPLLLALGFGTLWAFPTYGGFLCGEVLLGLGHAVLSGPPGTILYETLREHGQAHRYLAEESRASARRLVGTGSAFLLGGLLARFGAADGRNFEAVIAATCVLNLAAAAIACCLRPEPGRPALRPREFLREVRTDVGKPAVVWLLGYWIVLFALLRYPFHNYQPYLDDAGALEPVLRDPLFVGVLFAMLNLAAAPMSSAVPKLVQHVGRRPLFWGMPAVLCASFFVMAWERHEAEAGRGSAALAWLGVAMFFVQQVPFGMHWALLQEFVNHRIGRAARTTILSLLSLGARFVYAGCNVLLFRSQQANGMAATLAGAGAIGLAAAALVLWLRPRGLLRGDAPVA